MGGLLNEQNPLSVTEVICQQSLKCLAKYPTDFYEISPAEERSLIIVEFELHYTMLYCVSKFINTEASAELSRDAAKN